MTQLYLAHTQLIKNIIKHVIWVPTVTVNRWIDVLLMSLCNTGNSWCSQYISANNSQ